jgi:putative transposase
MARKMKQLELPPKGRGGRRPGAGRPKRKQASVPHLQREAFAARFPLHVTLKMLDDVGDLRTHKRFRRIQRAFFFARRMTLQQFSVQGNHIHLIVEARDKSALATAIQALCIRIARGVNRESNRRGTVFADRYHLHVLKTPEEVRNAVHYVLHNRQKHHSSHRFYVDPFSSASGEACWYIDERLGSAMIVVDPQTWLGQAGTTDLRYTPKPKASPQMRLPLS